MQVIFAEAWNGVPRITASFAADSAGSSSTKDVAASLLLREDATGHENVLLDAAVHGAVAGAVVDVGDTVVVQLTVPPSQPPDARPDIESSNPHALVAHGSGPVTTPRGIVTAFFEARKAGPVQIRVEGESGYFVAKS